MLPTKKQMEKNKGKGRKKNGKKEGKKEERVERMKRDKVKAKKGYREFGSGREGKAQKEKIIHKNEMIKYSYHRKVFRI